MPNLYPVQLLGYDATGELVPLLPPSIGFPDVGNSGLSDRGSVATTIGGPSPIR